MDDQPEEQAPQQDAAPAPKLPAAVEDVLTSWWSATVQTVGPLVNTPAYNALCGARDNLRQQLAAVLQ